MRQQLPGKTLKCLTSTDAVGDFPFFFKKKKQKRPSGKKMMSCKAGSRSYADPGDSALLICLNSQLTLATSL
jgi:hypothetical protein